MNASPSPLFEPMGTQQNTVALPATLSVRHGLYRNCQSPARPSRETHFFDFLFPCEGG